MCDGGMVKVLKHSKICSYCLLILMQFTFTRNLHNCFNSQMQLINRSNDSICNHLLSFFNPVSPPLWVAINFSLTLQFLSFHSHFVSMPKLSNENSPCPVRANQGGSRGYPKIPCTEVIFSP